MKKKILLFILFLVHLMCFGQLNPTDQLRVKIIKGDLDALKKLALFLDSKKVVPDFLGYHNLSNTEKNIAARIIDEEVWFSEDDKFDSSFDSKKFLQYIDRTGLKYDEDCGYFLPANFQPAATSYELRRFPEPEYDSLKNRFKEENYPGWVRVNQIDWLIKRKNPECLLLIARHFLKVRNKWNIYDFSDDDYKNILKFLTHLEFAVPDDHGNQQYVYHITPDQTRKNLVSYFTYHYKDYEWNDSAGYFLNTRETGKPKDSIAILFELFKSENDSLALDAFSRLAEMDVTRVRKFAAEYARENSLNKNYSLPIFPYNFLEQMVEFTRYCREHQVAYKAVGALAAQFNRLLEDLSFKERYRLENELINNLPVEALSQLEFFGLVNESNSASTYSVGRILDKCYSRNWSKLVADKPNLLLYLKKSTLFKQLGIIGTCNKYLRKFENADPVIIASVRQIQNESADPDIVTAAAAVTGSYSKPVYPKLKPVKEWSGEKNYSVSNLGLAYRNIVRSKKSKDEKESSLKELFGKISYRQLGEALTILSADSLLDNYGKYHILESDFGFCFDELDSLTISHFTENYRQLSEKDMYLKNLLDNGIALTNPAGEINYNLAFDILKYDVVDGFVGGGGGRRDDNVYPVIKLLEMKFGTTLGFINKLCSWQGIWGCECDDRAKYWMQFLVQQQLVVPVPGEPVSISYNN